MAKLGKINVEIGVKVAAKKSAKVPLVEGFQMRVRDMRVDMDYHYVNMWSGEVPHSVGQTMELNLRADSGDYSKEDWGELMQTLTAGEVVVVIGHD